MTFDVNHDVAVMSVFDLEQKSDNAVSRHGDDEIATGALELFGVLVPVGLHEVLVQPEIRLSAQLVAGFGVGDALDHSALKNQMKMTYPTVRISIVTKTYPRSRSHHPVRKQIQVQTDCLEDVLENADHLQGQHVLSDVIAHFEDGRLPKFGPETLLVVLVGGNRHGDVLQLVDAAPRHLEFGQVRCFGGALHRNPALIIDIQDHSFGIAGQVASGLHLNAAEGRQTGPASFGAFRKRADLARNARDFVEKVEFALVKSLGRTAQLADDAVHQVVQYVVQIGCEKIPKNRNKTFISILRSFCFMSSSRYMLVFMFQISWWATIWDFLAKYFINSVIYPICDQIKNQLKKITIIKLTVS